LKGWTDTVVGYCNEASKEATLLLRNRLLQGHPYTWDVGINFELEQTPKQISDTWSKVRRKLNQAGVVAYRVLETTTDGHGKPTNRVHYHLLVKSQHTKHELEGIIDRSIPEGIPYHKHIKPIKNQWGFICYILKARVEGRRGEWLKDLYRNERILFRPNLGIKKIATVGKFWTKPKAKIWEEIKAQEEQIGNNLEEKKLRRLVNFVHEDFFGGQMARKDIERSIGRHADNDGIRRWAEQVFARWTEQYEQAP
jgi:hypothetical protein